MKNDPKQKKKNLKNAVIAIVSIAVAITALIVWLTPWVWYDTSPKPLGSQLEYIGKKDYGCWLGYCDSKPGTTYYYATDMSLEEVVGYFRGATLRRSFQADSFSNYDTLWLETSKGDVNVNFYKDKEIAVKRLNIPTPKKTYVISIPYFDYLVAKDAL